MPMKNTVYSLFFAITLPMQAWATPASDLEFIYQKNPALLVQFNPTLLQGEASRILGDKEKAQKIFEFITNDFENFLKTREKMVKEFQKNPPKNLARIVVSGQSVTGMITAALAAQAGHKVDVYDLRLGGFTRDIQWSVRQAAPDILASIDAGLAQRFVSEVATDMARGYTTMKGTDKEVTEPRSMSIPDPRRVPQDSNELLSSKGVATVQVKKFEKVLFEFLKSHPNVTQRKGKIEIGKLDPTTRRHIITEFEDVTPKGQKEKVFREVRKGTPITIIAEGGGSASRASLNIESAAISPERFQIAGVAHIENGGEIVTHYRYEDTSRYLTTSMGTTGSAMRWVVADLDENKITPDPKKFGSDIKDTAYIQEKARLLELEFKRVAALNMRIPLTDLDNIAVSGAIEKMPLQPFKLQQHISAKAASGTNVLLLADAAGNGHWNVGGGMHVGAITHNERVKSFLATVDSGGSEIIAAKKYSDAVIADSRVWGERGLRYFYDKLPDPDAKKAYNIAADLYFENKVKSPVRALDLMLPEGRQSTVLKSIHLKCDDIARRILGEI